ncbi:hypothetical protein [Citrobacter portucalensis]|nr:hypothetical protein [Citrobacter portucalensis]MCX8985117.1 hypothetical protein [Citrobacter portucalensis]
MSHFVASLPLGQLVGDVLDVLAVMRQRAADVLEQLNDQLNTEQSP